MKNTPILSIIVPTKNRPQYLQSVVSYISGWHANNFELIIHDNSDQPMKSIENIARDNPCIKYIFEPEQIDMVENFERAVWKSSGEFICILGDDDSITEESIDLAIWANYQRLDAVVPSTVVGYLWPDVKTRLYGKHLNGIVRVRRFSGKVRLVDPIKELTSCLRSGGQKFASLPRSYFGLVRRDILVRIKAEQGMIFPGPSPDLSGAVALSLYCTKIADIDYPIFVQGTGRRSNGGLGAKGLHFGKLENYKHLPHRIIKEWSIFIPPFFAGSTIWAEDVIQTLQRFKSNKYLYLFNGPRFFAVFLLSRLAVFPMVKKYASEYLRVTSENKLKFLLKFAVSCIAYTIERISAFIVNVTDVLNLNIFNITFPADDASRGAAQLQIYLKDRRGGVNNFLSIYSEKKEKSVDT